MSVKKLLNASAAIVLCFSVTTVYAITYLKEGMSGSGASWDDACGTVSDAITAATAGDKVIYAAKGVYFMPSQVAPAATLSIYGGFPGISMDETLSDRDTDAHQTIFTGDKLQDDTWMHLEPTLGAYTLKTTATEQCVIIDGMVSTPPPFTGEYDGWCSKMNGTNGSKGFLINASIGITLDGIWFTGFLDSSNQGACVHFMAKAAASTINDCRFVGNYVMQGCINDSSESTFNTISNCKFWFNRTQQRGSAIISRGKTNIGNCEFLSCTRTGSNGGNVIYFWQASNINIVNSVFTRCFAISDAEWSETAYGGTGVIVASEGGTGSFIDCVFSNNFASSKFYAGQPLFATRNSEFTRCLFVGNRMEVKPVKNRSYGLFGNQVIDNVYTMLDSCTFTSNTITAPQVTATEGSFGLGIIANAGNGLKCAAINCTFHDNIASAVSTNGITPILSRGVLLYAYDLSHAPQMSIANCTFSGAEADRVFDVAQIGTSHSMTLTVLNSVFNHDGDGFNSFYSETPSLFFVRDCSVENMYLAPEALSIDGADSDKTPLTDLAPLFQGSVPVRQVTARMPNIRKTADIATNTTAFPAKFSYRLRDTNTWTPLVSSIQNGNIGNAINAIADACGNTRQFGEYTRGAVQPLTDTAETGVSLILRKDPPSGGIFSPVNGYAQAIPTGSQPTTVTAIPAADTAFTGWYDADNTLYSENATLSIASLTKDTLLTAKFATPQISITFDLGQFGTFEENGESQITIESTAGTEFTSFPVCNIESGWIFEGWTPELPLTIPWTNALYTAKCVSTDLRVIYVVPQDEVPPDSDGSGSSWENACGNLNAAYADAGRYRGEVWMKEGVYTLISSIGMLSNVKLIGGFAGNETSAAQADPVNHPTIISGDIKGNDCWNTTPQTKIWNGSIFNEPNQDNATLSWRPNGNNADDTLIAFSVPFESTTTNTSFHGLTLTCFGKSSISVLQNNTQISISNCRFIANNTTYSISDESSGAISAKSCSISLSDCEFIGNSGSLRIYGTSAFGGTNIIENCLFKENEGANFGAGIRLAGSTPVIIKNCQFVRNTVLTEAWRQSAAITIANDSCVWIDDCLFEGNRVTGNAYGTIVTESNTSGKIFITRCTFLNNKMYNVNDDRSFHSACIANIYGKMIFVRDSFFSGNSAVVNQTKTTRYVWGSVFCGKVTTFLNSTFIGNSVTSSGTGASVCGTFAPCQGDFALINCSVTGSVFSGPNCGEIVNDAGTEANTMAIINTVIENDSTNYVPFNIAARCAYALADCSISGLVTNGLSTANKGYIYNASAANAKLTPSVKTGGDKVKAIGVSSMSPFARTGRPIWIAADGYAYMFDDVASTLTPWRRVVSKGASYAAINGISIDTPPVPDAFGNERKIGAIAYGPLNAPPKGAILIIR